MGRVLITGAGGLLGANLALAALERHAVVAAHGRHAVAIPGAESIGVDLTDEAACGALVAQTRPDWIIHCAANTNVDACEREPDAAYDLHVTASRYLAEHASKCGAGMVYISTDAVYCGECGDYSEDEAGRAVNVYARTKLEGEHAVMDTLPDALIVRTTLYGWNVQPKQSLAEWALAELEAGRSIRGFTDAVFSPILANDLAGVLLDAVEQRLHGVYNVAGREPCSKHAFVTRLAEVFGLDTGLIAPARLEDGGFAARRAHNVSMRVEKIERALGRAMPSLDEGLCRFKALRDAGYVDRLKALGR